MTTWNGKPYHSLDYSLRKKYGGKVYKVSLDAGMTCPNRDGSLDTRGCIFCSAGGSGDFAGSCRESITEQIDRQIQEIRGKRPIHSFIAYFQAYTNTYAPLSYLRKVFTEALLHPDITALSVGTRPDCLPEETLALLGELNRRKPVTVELGLQTIHKSTAEYIRRGYDLSCFENAVTRLRSRDLDVVVHTILGLPGETHSMILETMDYLNTQEIQGIKLQLLHVLQGTDLARDFENHVFRVLPEDVYITLLIDCLEHLRPDIVIHRVTGDGPANLLIEPQWARDKRHVLNELHHRMAVDHHYQGRLYVRKE